MSPTAGMSDGTVAVPVNVENTWSPFAATIVPVPVAATEVGPVGAVVKFRV